MIISKKAFVILCCIIPTLGFRADAVSYSFVNINFFTQDVTDNGASAVFRYFPFKFSDDKASIFGVRLNYIMTDNALVSVPLVKNGDYFSTTVAARAGAVIDYYYTLQCVPLAGSGSFSNDTRWFSKTVGMPPNSGSGHSLLVQLSGRFRDHNENELRSDIFPGADYESTVYSLSITDFGDSLQILAFPNAVSSAMQLLAFNHIVTDSICERAEYALNMGSTTNFLVSQHIGPAPGAPAGSPFGSSIPWYSATIAAVAAGELVEFELSLTEAPLGRILLSTVHRYYVGSGKVGQKFQHPWANAAGDASISSVTEPQFAFGQLIANAQPSSASGFLAGRSLFTTDWNTSYLVSDRPGPDCNGNSAAQPNDKSPFFSSGALGSKYLQSSCCVCHYEAGPGHPADSATDSLQAIVFLGIRNNGKLAPHPVYGDMLKYKATGGAIPDGNVQITYSVTNGAFADGTPYSLRKPLANLVNLSQGPLGPNAVFSYRVSPFLCGAGLLAAIPDDSILAQAALQAKNTNGVHGKALSYPDPLDGVARIGRFGYKASVPSLAGQIAYLANRCCGLTNPYFPNDTGAAASFDLSDSNMASLLTYVSLLAPPPRVNWQDSSSIRGKTVFEASGCALCHVPATRTGVVKGFPELDNLEIQPFTDMLVHTMGPDLADTYGVDSVSAAQWRTAPLWGVGFKAAASGRESYLHDGRARTILEAILWHGGEAQNARTAVLRLSAQQRDDLVAFCKYPFADRLPKPVQSAVAIPAASASFLQGILVCQPNPVRTVARFMFPRDEWESNPAIKRRTLSLFDVRGRCVFSATIPPGTHDFFWNSNKCRPGRYLARLAAKSSISSTWFVLTK